MPVELEGIASHNARCVCSAFRVPRSVFERLRQPSILFNCDHPQPAGEQLPGQAPLPRPDLQDDVAGHRLERVDDATEDVAVVEEVLAEAARAHALRRTTVRSSDAAAPPDRKSTRLNSSHVAISYAVFCLKKKNI